MFQLEKFDETALKALTLKRYDTYDGHNRGTQWSLLLSHHKETFQILEQCRKYELNQKKYA